MILKKYNIHGISSRFKQDIFKSNSFVVINLLIRYSVVGMYSRLLKELKIQISHLQSRGRLEFLEKKFTGDVICKQRFEPGMKKNINLADQ